MKNKEDLIVIVALITALFAVLKLLEIFEIGSIVEQLAAIEKAVTP